MRPPDYLLPVNDKGVAYWEINLLLCLTDNEWKKWQGGKPMSEIIPRIKAEYEN